MSITPGNLELVYGSAYVALNNIMQMPDHDPNRKGGYLSLVSKNSGRVEAVLLVGECDAPHSLRYYRFCLEKADRLYMKKSHKSSFQSRDEREQMYQGAIKCPRQNLILSFSGFNEPEDETISLVSAIGLDSITLAEAMEIAAISDNQFFAEYIAKYGGYK